MSKFVRQSSRKFTLLFGLWVIGLPAAAAPTALMSSEWAAKACDAWNQEPTLTDKLQESGWVDNDAEQGYKVIHLYREDCADSPTAELRIGVEQNKAMCLYGGAVETTDLNTDVNYVMYADTERWQQMGNGEYGPMKAMLFRRLKFIGPKFEAMRNMGAFGSFLLLVGKVPADMTQCPEQ